MPTASQNFSNAAFESALSSLSGVDLLAAMQSATMGIDESSPEFEAALRTKVVLDDSVIPQSMAAGDGDAPVAVDELEDLLRRTLAEPQLVRSEYLPQALFVWFEWHNRNNSDRVSCLRKWEDIFDLVDSHSDDARVALETSLYLYAKSRWLHQAKSLKAALEAARKASAEAPNHPGFLNNYGEILVDCYEKALFDEGEAGGFDLKTLTAEAQEAAHAFGRLSAHLEGAGTYHKYWRPSFIVTCEMLTACGSAEGLIDDDGGFDKARELLRYLHEGGDKVFGNEPRFISEMGAISNKQSLFYLIGNFKRMHHVVDEQRQSNQQLKAQMDELEEKLTDNRISVIETLGFFSAIIALIITSVQAGEGLSFGLRALFVLVLLGALLIAFGSLDIIIAPYRKDYPPKEGRGFLSRVPIRAKMLWIIGLAVIVLGCALAFLPYPEPIIIGMEGNAG